LECLTKQLHAPRRAGPCEEHGPADVYKRYEAHNQKRADVTAAKLFKVVVFAQITPPIAENDVAGE
jgi:hypothetical protein